MGEFLSYVGCGIVAAWFGWHARGIILLYKLSRNPEATIQLLEELKALNASEAKEQTTTDAIELTVESVKGLVYLFDKNTDRFIGQGATLAEAMQMAKERFPNKTFWCNTQKQDSQTA